MKYKYKHISGGALFDIRLTLRPGKTVTFDLYRKQGLHHTGKIMYISNFKTGARTTRIDYASPFIKGIVYKNNLRFSFPTHDLGIQLNSQEWAALNQAISKLYMHIKNNSNLPDFFETTFPEKKPEAFDVSFIKHPSILED